MASVYTLVGETHQDAAVRDDMGNSTGWSLLGHLAVGVFSALIANHVSKRNITIVVNGATGDTTSEEVSL